MQPYLNLLRDILDNGVKKDDRTGTGTLSVFGRQLRFDLADGFPLLTTKKMHVKSIIYELLWFLRGETNIGWLKENGVTIWDEWADENGELGPVYGFQWRNWPGPDGSIDQVCRLVNLLKADPDSRRMIVTAWHPGYLKKMALPPCHLLWQVWTGNGKLSLQMYQRSVDTFLGLPFNIASYALLTMMLAQVSGFEPGELILCLGDTHLYLNHLEKAGLQLSRAPLHKPTMLINPDVFDINGFKYSDFRLEDYYPHPAIKADISI